MKLRQDSLILPAAITLVTYMCISLNFDQASFAKIMFNASRNIGVKIIYIMFSYAMMYLLSTIIFPVWFMLKSLDKLTLANLCFTCAVLGICCPMVGYFILGNRNLVMLLLYRPEIIMSYLLSAVVFALVLWWIIHGSKRKASTHVRQDPEDYG